MARRRGRRGGESARVWLFSLKMMVFLGAAGASGFYGYEVGRRLSLDENAAQRQELERVAAEAQKARETIAGLEAQLAQASTAAAEYKQRYEEVNPSEEVKELTALVKGKLASGIDLRRISLAITSADRPRNCVKADTKRFMVKTPRYDGANTWVRFNDLITVTAEGVPETGANGQPNDWFDSAKDVSVSFTLIGGKESKASGKLPLQHSVVVKNAEYRFTVEAGAKGFVEVTGDRCDYRG